MNFVFAVFIIAVGLLFGSFIGMLTYRLPRGMPFILSRSFCPSCRKTISWYDNVPVFSFILLRGHCRNCGKKISWRYPIIEFSTTLGFFFIYVLVEQGRILSNLGWVALPYLLFVFLVLETIFIVDLEHKVIFDNFVSLLFVLFFLVPLFLSDTFFWNYLFSAFFLSSILLVLNLITKGKGMGLGDVKLALPLGFFFGFSKGLVWLFISFLTGAVVGVILILMGKANFGRQVPFGPFLIFSFWLVVAFSEKIDTLLRFF